MHLKETDPFFNRTKEGLKMAKDDFTRWMENVDRSLRMRVGRPHDEIPEMREYDFKREFNGGARATMVAHWAILYVKKHFSLDLYNEIEKPKKEVIGVSYNRETVKVKQAPNVEDLPQGWGAIGKY